MEEQKNRVEQTQDADKKWHGGHWVTPRKLRRKSHRDLWERLGVKMVAVRVALVTSVLFLLTAILSVVLLLQLNKVQQQRKNENKEAEHEYLGVEIENKGLKSQLADLEEERSDLIGQLTQAMEELEAMQDGDALVSGLRSLIADLEGKIAEKDLEIAALKDKLTPDAEVNLQTVQSQMQAVEQLLKSGAPMQLESVKKTDEFGSIYYEDEMVYPMISLYLYDTGSGLSYVWEVNTSYDVGELKYLTLALAIVDGAIREQELLEGDGDAQIVYDLNAEYLLREEDIVSGAGVIKNQPIGTKYTYLELIEVMLSCSDATAYRLLSDRYPGAVSAYLPTVQGLSSKDPDSSMTAKDVMALLKSARRLIDGGSAYAKALTTAMASSAQTHFAKAVGGDVAQQCTLTTTSYHELGVELSRDDGYLVVLMTNMSKKTTEADAYYQRLYRALDELMENFV